MKRTQTGPRWLLCYNSKADTFIFLDRALEIMNYFFLNERKITYRNSFVAMYVQDLCALVLWLTKAQFFIRPRSLCVASESPERTPHSAAHYPATLVLLKSERWLLRVVLCWFTCPTVEKKWNWTPPGQMRSINKVWGDKSWFIFITGKIFRADLVLSVRFYPARGKTQGWENGAVPVSSQLRGCAYLTVNI